MDARRAVVHSHALHTRWVGDPARRRFRRSRGRQHRRHGRPAWPGSAPWRISPRRVGGHQGPSHRSGYGAIGRGHGASHRRGVAHSRSAVPARRPEWRGAVQRRPPDARRRQWHGQRRAARSQRVDAPAGQRKAGRRDQDRHTRHVAGSAARAAQRHRHRSHLFGATRRAVHPRGHDHRGRCRVPGDHAGDRRAHVAHLAAPGRDGGARFRGRRRDLAGDGPSRSRRRLHRRRHDVRPVQRRHQPPRAGHSRSAAHDRHGRDRAWWRVVPGRPHLSSRVRSGRVSWRRDAAARHSLQRAHQRVGLRDHARHPDAQRRDRDDAAVGPAIARRRHRVAVAVGPEARRRRCGRSRHRAAGRRVVGRDRRRGGPRHRL